MSEFGKGAGQSERRTKVFLSFSGWLNDDSYTEIADQTYHSGTGPTEDLTMELTSA